MRYSNCNLNRRDFVRAIGAATLGAGPVFAGGRPLDLLSPGIKISLQIPGDFTAEDLVFARQLGVEYVSIPDPWRYLRDLRPSHAARRGRRS